MERAAFVDLVTTADPDFSERVPDLLEPGEYDARRLARPVAAAGEALAGVEGPAFADRPAHERRLVYRAWVLDSAPFGVTVAAPAYRDTRLVYASRTFRDLTGYPLADLAGENPRLLQGPATEPAATATLREAVDIWEPATVELTNYRRDGTPFRQRVTVTPTTDATGTVANWVGVHRAVDAGQS